MPEKGWSALTVRDDTAKKLKAMAKARNFTIDELIQELINPSAKEGWAVCEFCKINVKTRNLHEHVSRVHPNRLTVKRWVNYRLKLTEPSLVDLTATVTFS